MPWMSGGGTTSSIASLMSAVRLRASAMMPWMLTPSFLRSSKLCSGTYAAALFGASVCDGPSKPASMTEPFTPGIGRMRATTLRITSSVRSSDEPGGSWMTVRK